LLLANHFRKPTRHQSVAPAVPAVAAPLVSPRHIVGVQRHVSPLPEQTAAYLDIQVVITLANAARHANGAAQGIVR